MNYKCKKCGITGASKCASSRNFFTDNSKIRHARSLVAVKENVRVDVKKGDEGNRLGMDYKEVDLIIDFTVYDAKDTGSSLVETINYLKQFDEVELKQIVCRHDMVPVGKVGDTCLFGCCKAVEE